MVMEEVVIWSASCGAFAALTLVSFTRAIRYSSGSAWRQVVWMVVATHVLLFLSGLAPFVYTQLSPSDVRTGQVLAGPLWVSLSFFMFRFMLRSWQRSRAMNGVLWSASLCGVVLCCVIVQMVPVAQQLHFSAGLTLGMVGLVVLISVWSGLMGDVLSWSMALACAMAMPVLAGLYGPALQYALPLSVQALLAIISPLIALLISTVSRPRDDYQHQATLKTLPEPDRDPLTKLYNSASIARKIVAAQKRQRWMRGSGVVIGVHLFEPEALLRQYGQAGLDAVLVRMSARLELALGYINPVGRYDGHFFIVLVETVHSKQRLDSMLNGMVRQLRRPITVMTTQGDDTDKLLPDFGVGFVTLSPRMNVDTVLFSVQEAARHNRVVPKSPINGEAVSSLPPETTDESVTPVKPAPTTQGNLSFKKHSAASPLQ